MTQWDAKRVLVPFDFSERSLDAVRLALQIAEDDCNVHVHHVMVDWYPTHPAAVLTDFDENDLKGKSFTAMEEALDEANVDLERVELNVSIGDPGTKIAELADEIGASLIVIPSHGRQGVSRWFIGSVAERVVRLAHCPVLVLKEKEPPQALDLE